MPIKTHYIDIGRTRSDIARQHLQTIASTLKSIDPKHKHIIIAQRLS